MLDTEKVEKIIDIISQWEGFNFWVKFLRIGQSTWSSVAKSPSSEMPGGISKKSKTDSRPVAVVIELSAVPVEAKTISNSIRMAASAGLPVYYSFASAANAINLVLNHYEKLRQ